MKQLLAMLCALCLVLTGCRSTGGEGTGSVLESDVVSFPSSPSSPSSASTAPLHASSEAERPSSSPEEAPPESAAPSQAPSHSAPPAEPSSQAPPPQEAAEPGGDTEEAIPAQEPLTLPGASSDPAAGLLIQSGSSLAVDDIERELLRLVNAERNELGIEQLGLEENMLWAARVRAEEVLVLLMHTRPDGTPYNTAFDQVGLVYAGRLHGENIATFQFPPGAFSAEEVAGTVFDKLRSSAGHSQNMFSASFIQVGIGVYVEESEDLVRVGVAQLFLGL